MGAWTSVDNPGAAFAEGITHVGGAGRADVAEGIGAGSGKGADLGEDLAEGGVRGNAHRNGVETCGDEVGDDGEAAQDDGEGSGPKRREGDETGVRLGDGGERSEVGDVDDERIDEGTSLGRKHLGERGGVERVGGETVDGLGRQCDDFAGAEEGGSASEVGGRRGEKRRKGGHGREKPWMG
jgi:hypothetical protein